ncbi:DegT/DnrJ/EryC1/StrS family aminotransferase [Pedobacter alpinus]|uniref:DegT/DnrJ/EryC1/StrS family aminotransferase n=1 Tax=Pedobacter alpinus TaxID=1590643 RepID=A0ABW5TR41_9SPHI
MTRAIKMIDLPAEYLQLQSQLLPKIDALLLSGNYIQGNAVKEFEKELSIYLNVKHVISCGNGTDALQIALMGLNIKAGDEIIIPAFSYVAVIEVICLLGAKPVLVDVDPTYFQLDNHLVEQAITSKTKAIIPVHLFGQCTNFDELLKIAKQHNIYVIEDTAQALGAKNHKNQFLGTIGDIGCTSFFPTKNLSCFGDGGALFTNDDELAKKIRMIANHGQSKKYHHEIVGVNSRLDSIQAVVLSHKLPLLNTNLQKKKEIAHLYINLLEKEPNIELPKASEYTEASWHQFTIKVKDGLRNPLKTFLQENGIDAMVYYPKSLGQQTAYQHFYSSKNLVSDQLCTEVLSLPIHPLLTEADIIYICKNIHNFFNAES